MTLEINLVSPADIDTLMSRVMMVGGHFEGTTTTVLHAFLDETFYLGSAHSVCQSPEEFQEATGTAIAREQLVQLVRTKLWEMESYRTHRATADALV